MDQNKVQLDILEAETHLNQTIQNSLNQFKNKLHITLTNAVMTPTVCKETSKSERHSLEKVHVMRESLLSTLMEIPHYKTIYNIVLASFIPLTLMILIENWSKHGQIIDFKTLSECFRQSDKVFLFWWVLAFNQYSVILITAWILKSKPPVFMWLPVYLIHLMLLLCIPVYVVENYTLGFGTRMIIMIEGVRMMMKSHSYLRTKLLYCTDNKYKNELPEFAKKHHSEHHKVPNIDFKDISTEIARFSYFFIAPTLIYRDSYSLNPSRRFGRVFVHFCNFVLCTYYAFMVYMLCCKPVIEEFGSNINWVTFCLTTLRLMLPSMLFLFLGFFGFLHSWLNCWAEITRFPDRVFYLDWWTSIEFGSYYRKWNIVVHDWLYYYLYFDLSRFVLVNKEGRVWSKLLTFLISAIIHEWIIVYAVGFFYPVLFVLFTGPGIILIQNQKRLKIITFNLLFWIEMYLGTSLIFVLYLSEFYARQIISDKSMNDKWGVLSILIPRTLQLL